VDNRAGEASNGTVLPLRVRNPVVSSIVVTTVLAAALLALALLLPLEGNVDHAIGHLSLAIPVLLFLAAVVFTWPPLGVGRPARWVRIVLLVALAMFGGGLVLEALGAFGYSEDPLGEANDLAVLHDIGVSVSSSGFILTVAAGILTVAVTIAARRGAGQSGLLAAAVVLVVLVVVAFLIGALIFGY
jgi:hypothetical protein